MDNLAELLNQINLKKSGLSLIMDNQNITSHDIMNTFYSLTHDVEVLGIQYFRLDAYNIVFGDFVLNIQYTKDNKTYYMMIGANSKFASLQQIAVGTAIGDKVYMMCESFPNTNSINFIAFPKFVINQKTKGFSLKSYRDTIRVFARTTFLADESIKCLEAGLESMNAFCELINQVKNQNKRKKLSL